mmetsp:Transcript_24678/g.60639  ORF Transcript_24678/g.60639 Transcript_24678/m.60639 type:complete len:685 (-) Transcript_24678:212-2266(-)
MGNTLDKPKTEKETSVGVGSTSEDGLSWGVSSMQGWRLTMEDAHICAQPKHSNSSCVGEEKKLDISLETTGDDDSNTRPGGNMSVGNQVSSKDPNKAYQSNGQSKENGDEIEDGNPKEELTLPPHHYFFCVLDGHGGDFAAHYSRDHLLPLLLEQDAFQEYERIWRATTTLSTSLSEFKTPSSDASTSSSSSKFGSSKKRKKKGWRPKKKKEDKTDDSSHQNHTIKSKWKKNSKKISKKIAANRNNQEDRNHLELQEQSQQLLQRALEDAFVELDLVLLQEMVRRKMVVIPPPSNQKDDDHNAWNMNKMDDWGNYDHDMEEEDANDSSTNFQTKSQNAKGDTISGTTVVAVLVTPDWIICANLGDSRASLLLSSPSSSNSALSSSSSSIQNGNSMIHEQSPIAQHHHTNKKKKSKRKETKKKNSTLSDEGSCSQREEEEEDSYWTIVAMSEDHTPDLPEEHARIEAADGIVTMGGRVDGELAVSRALGDFGFKEHYPRHLYSNCESITKRQSRRRRRRRIQQAKLQQAGDESNGIDGKLNGEKEKDLDWEHQRKLARHLKVSPFPEVFAYPRGKPKHEGNGKEELSNGPCGGEKILLLGCDGIWDVMTNENCHHLVQELLAEGETNMGLIAEEILDTCLKKGSRDNMTMMVVHFSDAMMGGGANQIGATSGGGVLKRRKQRNSV